MGRVQNGHLYIRYRSSSLDNKADKWNKVTDYMPLLFYCYLHSISSASLSQSWENQTWMFRFCSTALFLLSPSRITWKQYSVCRYYTYQTAALLSGFLCGGVRYQKHVQVGVTLPVMNYQITGHNVAIVTMNSSKLGLHCTFSQRYMRMKHVWSFDLRQSTP